MNEKKAYIVLFVLYIKHYLPDLTYDNGHYVHFEKSYPVSINFDHAQHLYNQNYEIQLND